MRALLLIAVVCLANGCIFSSTWRRCQSGREPGQSVDECRRAAGQANRDAANAKHMDAAEDELRYRASVDLACDPLSINLSVAARQGPIPISVHASGCGSSALYNRKLRRHRARYTAQNTVWERIASPTQPAPPTQPAGPQRTLQSSTVGQPNERFPVHPIVPEAVKNADGTVPVAMHPWLFMGALSKGKGNCEPSEMFSFGSVKDLSQPQDVAATAQESPICEYAVTQTDASAQWTATCTLHVRGHAFESRRELNVAIEGQRNEGAEGWVHEAVFARQAQGAGADGSCVYMGRVVHRGAQL